MTFVSYAQNFEDVLLWRALRGVTGGFYIDVGAAHPDIDSVTRAFYDRGWSGINIEPTEEFGHRLSEARPRDVNLQIVLGERAGSAQLLVVEGTGLSTLDVDAVASLAEAGMVTQARPCQMETLAELCRRYAPPVIHFLKIDVEGAEAAVLAGADFATYRPWIVVVEATAPMSTVETHVEWEPALLRSAYRFVWFDGLNRFYVSEERAEALAQHFRTPPNVFDDFIRAADSEVSRRIGDAERRSVVLSSRTLAAEARAKAAEARALVAEAHASATHSASAEARMAAERHLAELRAVLHNERQRLVAGATADDAWMRAAETRLHRAEEQRSVAFGWLDALFRSTSWRATAALRRLRAGGPTQPPQFADLPVLPPRPNPLEEAAREPVVAAPATEPAPPAPARRITPGLHLRTVHQFHSGSASGDAITNGMLLLRDVLRDCGYRSEIFVEHRAPELSGQLRPFDELPEHDQYVLIVHHSMGYSAFPKVASLRAPKVLFYHNITPPELAENAFQQRYAKLGREQLAMWRDNVSAALAASEYNAIELRTLGFDAVLACTMLFDIDRLLRLAGAVPARPTGEPFTVLFVGRVCAAKGQRELLEAYVAFRARFGRPCRLVLVGRHGGETDAYLKALRARSAETGVADSVEITGLVGDDELHARYAAADVFVCLSRHEGFCVPLVEAIAYGLPVVALAAGAVSYTLGDSDGLLTDDAPDKVAATLLDLAADAGLRQALCRSQRAVLERFRPQRQLPALIQALAHAGAAPPVAPDSGRTLSANMRFAVAGHVNGSYSLAAINRGMALNLEDSYPGRVRLLPVEGEPTTRLHDIPSTTRAAIERLVERPRPITGPEIVISQHYPVYVPAERGDLTVAMFFWEESIVPADTVAMLNDSFDAAFAPSRFVAKALIDSGVSIPVRHVGFSPRLDALRALAAARSPRGAGSFTVLHVSSCFPRKGVDLLLRAYSRAFRRGDAVRLVIKGFPNPHNDAATQIAKLRAQTPDLAEIEFIDRDMNEAELLALYAAADAMVLPTRGEGFNLPAAEALAAGLHVIATGYGGHMDFCAAGQARLIDFTFAPSRSHLASAHSVWAEPDEDDLVAALREAGAACRAPRPGAVVDTVARPWSDVATELLTAPPRQPVDIAWITSWDVRCGIAEYSRNLIEAMPASPHVGAITVLCDQRTASSPNANLRVLPCWNLGLRGEADSLARVIAVNDPRIVVIQHQPGLIMWAALAALLAHPALRERIVVITLHTTLRIFDAPASEQRSVLAELARVARVVVHTIDDLNRLKAAGLLDNVVLIPQGVHAGERSPSPPRAVTPNSFPLVGSYGFFLPDKGIPQLIRAVGLLRDRYPTIRLRLVNADYGTPDSRAEIVACREMAAAEGLAEMIEWHTDFLPHEEARVRLMACDVIALPYQTSKEASSAALRSALGADVPVLVTPLPLFAEAGDAVCRAPGFTPAALANGLEHLLESPVARGELQLAAAAWRQQRAWPAVAGRMQGMLLGLAAAATR